MGDVSRETLAAPRECRFCGCVRYRRAFHYEAPPHGETQFALPAGQHYARSVFCCNGCGHFESVVGMDTSSLYAGAYVDATYGAAGISGAFERIMALDPGNSDNIARVQRVDEFMRTRFGGQAGSLLDVGSGLCVFAAKMKQSGWNCTALDPDPRAATHARDYVGVSSIAGDFFDIAPDIVPGALFELVTFNKVLEHVADPVCMLARAHHFLNADGICYLEVPDGERAAAGGAGREEFFIEHVHVFSLLSLRSLAEQAGFAVLRIDRLVEPSTKFTLYAFLEPVDAERVTKAAGN